MVCTFFTFFLYLVVFTWNSSVIIFFLERGLCRLRGSNLNPILLLYHNKETPANAPKNMYMIRPCLQYYMTPVFSSCAFPIKIVNVFHYEIAACANPVKSNVYLVVNTTSTGHRYSIHRAQTTCQTKP